ncbi:4Fe-4S binding protein [Metabacillus fastidiosus]|uniref:4Fe-4S binding protein n=1 Tax=Metabacillus fastidiosus TaxID=1458 RepID=UPI003D2CB5A2
MIKYLSEDHCIKCNLCVKTCPTNVFEKVEDSHPIIARQEDCQTCFMCELYCPVDALFVSHLPDNPHESQEITFKEKEFMGSYREAVGWGKGRKSTASLDSYHLLKN